VQSGLFERWACGTPQLSTPGHVRPVRKLSAVRVQAQLVTNVIGRDTRPEMVFQTVSERDEQIVDAAVFDYTREHFTGFTPIVLTQVFADFFSGYIAGEI
jgi:hypothetical protein